MNLRFVNPRLPLFCAAALALGVALGTFAPLPVSISIFAALLLSGAIPFRGRLARVCLACFLLFGGLSANRDKNAVPAFLPGVYEVEGAVEELGVNSFLLSDVTFDGERADGRAIVYGTAELCERVRIGDRFRARAAVRLRTLRLEERAERVLYSVSASEGELQARFSLFRSIRRGISDALFSAMDEQPAAIGFALLTGSTARIETETLANARYGGIAHIFAVSGLHIGIFYSFLLQTLRLCRVRRPAWIWAVLPGLFLYCGICGFPASSLRAAVMCSVHCARETFGRKYDALTALGVAVCLILLFSPMQLYALGFRLSVLACLGIALFARKLRIPFAPRRLADGIALTLSAQVFTAPILLDAFGYFSAASLLLNLILVPLVAPLLLFLLIGTALFGCGVPFALLPAEGLLRAFLFLLSLADFSKLLLCGFSFGIALLPYFAALFFASDLPNLFRRVRLSLAAVLLAASFGSILLLHPPVYDFRLTVGEGGCVVRSREGSLLIAETVNAKTRNLLLSAGISEADGVLFLNEAVPLPFSPARVWEREDVDWAVDVTYTEVGFVVDLGGVTFGVGAVRADYAVTPNEAADYYIRNGRLIR